MPLNSRNTTVFHRTLYAGILQKVTLLKRNDDQQEGTVQAITLFQVRQQIIYKTSEPIQGDMTADMRCVWCIPRIELDRTGVHYLNALDRIVDKNNDYWQPEATTQIEVKLFKNHLNLFCLLTNPPRRQ